MWLLTTKSGYSLVLILKFIFKYLICNKDSKNTFLKILELQIKSELNRKKAQRPRKWENDEWELLSHSLKKRASLIGPKPHCEHIINHSIITAHQSILMPAVIIDSVGDNPSMGSLLSAGIWWSLDLNCIRAPVYLQRLSFSFSEAQNVVNIRWAFCMDRFGG